MFKIKHTVYFHSPGTFFTESSVKDIDSWNIKQAVEMAESIVERYSAKPYGFKFATYKTHPTLIDEEGNEYEVRSKLLKESGTYFLGGKLETYDEVVARNDPKEEILRSNMRCNGMWIICVNTNSYRSVWPFTEKDKIVDTSGNVIESGDNLKYIKYRNEQEAKRKQ
jgi:hypothetical protein